MMRVVWNLVVLDAVVLPYRLLRFYDCEEERRHCHHLLHHPPYRHICYKK
jgi:hypothetical protein